MILGLTGLVVFYLSKSLKIIPKSHIGVLEVFGKRNISKVYLEGLHFIAYKIEDVALYSLENNVRTFTVKVKSKDNVTINLSVAYEYIPDKNLMDVFGDNEKSLKEGALDNSIMNELGIVAGTKEALDFINQREAIVTFINCLLRLKQMPHDYPETIGIKSKPIPLGRRLEFYRKNSRAIKLELLDKEAQKVSEKSNIELQYGVDIKEFDLMIPDFDEAYNKAIQKDKEAAAIIKAQERTLELAKKYAEIPQKGINAMQVAMDQAERKVVSIEGLEDIFGGGK